MALAHCCSEHCDRVAEFGIRWGEKPDQYIEACSLHISDLIPDGMLSEDLQIFPLHPDQTPHQLRIEEFMRKASQDVPDHPQLPDEAGSKLRCTLILEEALETMHAFGLVPYVEVEISDDDGSNPRKEKIPFQAGMTKSGEIRWSKKWLHGPQASDELVPNIYEVADGCADISVVTMGSLSACGIKDSPVLAEVDAANLRKFGPGSYKREDGKWIKPPDWTGPDIQRVLEEQAPSTEK